MMHVTSKMVFHSDSKQRKKLGSILNLEEFQDDSHPQAVEGGEKLKWFHHKQHVEMKLCKSEEVVRYMSCLPSYLERGEKPQEKPFSLGVLDWSQLERWQHKNADIFRTNTEHSPSTSSDNGALFHYHHWRLNRPSTEQDRLRMQKNLSQETQSSNVNGLKDSKVVGIIRSRPSESSVLKGGDAKSKDQIGITDLDFSERRKTIVPKSRNDPGHKHFAECHEFDSSEGNKNSLVEENWCHTNSRSQNNRIYSIEDKKMRDSQQTIPFTQSASVSPSRRMDLGKKILVLEPRNPSPTRRLSFGFARIGKNSNSNSSDFPKQVSESASKVTSTSSCSNVTSRERSSPLRRLLDPLLKPKGVESREFARSSKRNQSARDGSLKPPSRQIESPALLPVKETIDLKGFRKVDIGGKNGISSIQALLQLDVKNGLPLFTFTVDNCRDILAATVKEISANEKIYSFFSFSKMKKKHTQWINKGSKDSNHGFVSNIVSMMKVSDKSGRTEFVLSAVSPREDSLPCDELAAVVVKYQEPSCEQLNQDGNECKPSNRGDYEGIESGNDPFTTTVILPGGNHGAPSKGEPSPLIKRWKEGGSCDCGGWDLGCQLTIFNSIKSQSNAFKLFSQEESGRPVFVLSPFQDGIFSAEFDSSLKPIQAFSIAIAAVHSQTSLFLSSSVSENGVSKVLKKSQVEVSAKYASNPPHSPVGRV